MKNILLSRKVLLSVLIITLGIFIFITFLTDKDMTVDMCKKIADKRFSQLHGRLPDRDDFVTDELIQNDWYPEFEKCLTDNQ